MKVLITGSHGTVGSALKQLLLAQGIEVFEWDRKSVPIDNYHAMEEYLRSLQPDVLFHLAIASQSTGRPNEGWMVNYEWTSELAWLTKVLGIKFIFTSTAMVFSDNAKGPFAINSTPDADEGYGYEKRMAEQRVFYQNPQATVVRLGWQIGDKAGSNNMIDYFERNMSESGKVNTSIKWYPACSFIGDTVKVLWSIAKLDSGLYMIDSNKKWNFFEIANALNELHGDKWIINPVEDFVYDQRLVDERVEIPSLKERLASLKEKG